jgi:hypothetical protein
MTLRSLSRRARLVLVALLGVLPVLAACGPSVVAGNPTDYSLNTHQAQRLRWNPCTTVHWRADLRNAPANTLPLVQGAVATLSAKTGIRFVYDGPASYVPQKGGFAKQPSSLIVSFGRAPGRPSSSNYLSGGSMVGYGGYQATGVYVGGGVKYTITKGFVVIDADRFPGLSTRTRSALLQHELGHAVGLNHAKYSSELMYPVVGNASPSSYAAGDLSGLRLVGRPAGCV